MSSTLKIYILKKTIEPRRFDLNLSQGDPNDRIVGCDVFITAYLT